MTKPTDSLYPIGSGLMAVGGAILLAHETPTHMFAGLCLLIAGITFTMSKAYIDIQEMERITQ